MFVPTGNQRGEDPFWVIDLPDSFQKLDIVPAIASDRVLVHRSIVHVLEWMIKASLFSS